MDDDILTRWVAHVTAELGIDLDNVDVQAILDLARDSAHAVVRPAAPVSTFLVGYAAGLRSAAGDDIAAECERTAALALAWPHTT